MSEPLNEKVGHVTFQSPGGIFEVPNKPAVAYQVADRTDFISVVLLDNQATPQVLFRYPSIKRFSFFLFSIERNGAFQQIYTQKVTNGVTVAGGNNSNNVGTTGITITAGIVGSNVEIYYTSTNTGFNGIFKYLAIEQWS